MSEIITYSVCPDSESEYCLKISDILKKSWTRNIIHQKVIWHVFIGNSQVQKNFRKWIDRIAKGQSKQVEQHLQIDMLKLMLVTDVGDRMCWWQNWDVDDPFSMLVTDLVYSIQNVYWKNQQSNEKIRQYNDSATSISNRSPTWRCHQHHCHPLIAYGYW